jgi:hypothetical protein
MHIHFFIINRTIGIVIDVREYARSSLLSTHGVEELDISNL